MFSEKVRCGSLQPIPPRDRQRRTNDNDRSGNFDLIARIRNAPETNSYYSENSLLATYVLMLTDRPSARPGWGCT